ncbi:MAG: hypothetical protein CVV28_12250 [Methanobacteriales archaeon HGW-Methanobacteriales-1]|jgi:hypothetical protein|nr:MAG: hypothetical protein CVV28_12250 [Methanobacteriales archaeon HGW-Methanobacteriales-1]
MVVELKGSDFDLDKPQNRANDKRTPVDQVFDYAQHMGDIDWILVSNYNEFRLYNGTLMVSTYHLLAMNY